MADTTVLVVGGGFAGVACAKALAKQNVKVLLIDENNYHQFQPLLYQVATAHKSRHTTSPAAARDLPARRDGRRGPGRGRLD